MWILISIAFVAGCTERPSPGAAKVVGASATHELTGVRLASPALLTAQDDGVVDARSGRLSLTATDVAVPVGAVRLVVERSFQSTPRRAGLLGTRWRLNWEQRLVRTSGLAMLDEASGITVFKPGGSDGHFESPSRDRLVVEHDRAVRTRRDGTRDVFDFAGRLVAQELRNGNRIVLRYDGNGRLSAVEGPYGAALRFETDKDGRLTGIDASTGATVRYAYGAAPLPAAAGGPVVRYGYDAAGALARIERPQFGVTELDYDSRGRVVGRVADGARERFEYDDTTLACRFIDAAGRITTTQWSADRRVLQTTDALGDKVVATYDDAGRPVQITGPSGETARIGYDRLGRVETIQDAAGRLTRLEYLDSSELVTAKTVADAPRQTYRYDAQQNLVEVRVGAQPVLQATYGPGGLVKSLRGADQVEQRFDYDAAGRLAMISDALGNQTRLEYDRRGNVVRLANRLGGIAWRYDEQDRPLSQTDAAGRTRLYEYGPDGRLARATNPDGGVSRFSYDANGRLLTVVDPSGKTSRYEYDARGRVTKAVLADGIEETYSYDAAGNLTGRKSASGASWTFTYDGLGRLLTEAGPLGDRMSLRYDASGRVVELTDARDRRTRLDYDALGRVVALHDASGRVRRVEYDADDRVRAIVDPLGRRLALDYDESGRITGLSRSAGRLLELAYEQGRPARFTGPAGAAVSLSHDAAGRLVAQRFANGESFRWERNPLGQVVRAVDGLGRVWIAAHTARGELATLTAPTGAVTRYGYNGTLGQLASTVDARGSVRRIDYDALGRRIRETDPLGRKSELSFGPGGQVDALKLPDGRVTRREYDLLGRLTAIRYAEGPSARFQYDVAGNPVGEEHGDSRAAYRYDDADRLVEAAYQPANTTVRYRYDDAGRRTSVEVDGIGRWDYEYDERDRVTTLRDAAGQVTRYGYDDAGRITLEALPNGLAVRRAFDGRGRMLAVSVRDAARRVVLDRRYEYDAAGNLVRETREPGARLAYDYDAESRLIGVRGAAEPERFGYDAVGNRLLTGNGAEYDAADQLKRFGDETFAYDARGRMTLRQAGARKTEYSYDEAGRLAAIKRDGRLLAEYGYDAQGRRVSKKAGDRTTHYVYDGARLLLELDDARHVVRAWTPGPEPDRPGAFAQGGRTWYPLTDAVGSVVALADAAGNAAQRFDYAPFGALRTGAGADQLGRAVSLGFAGGQYDAESRLYYFGARYYDPTLGRFLTRDPLPGRLGTPAGQHPYQYAYNNPLRYHDRDGAAPQDLSSTILEPAGAIGGASAQLLGEAAGTAFGKLDEFASMTPGYPGTPLTPAQRAASAAQLGQMFAPVGDVGARMAVGVVTVPAHVGVGLGEASVGVEQAWQKLNRGEYLGAAGETLGATCNVLSDAMCVVPYANAASRGIRGWRAAKELMATGAATLLGKGGPPPTRLYSAQENIIEILTAQGGGQGQGGRIWGQTEGSVYAGVSPRGRGGLGWLRNTREPRTGDIEFVFDGQAASLFEPHEAVGIFSGIKRLAGQYKAGFGDIQLLKWHWSDDLQLVVTEAKLLAGQHAGPPLSLFGGRVQLTHAQRLAGRRAFDAVTNVLTGGVLAGAAAELQVGNVVGMELGQARQALKDFAVTPVGGDPASPIMGQRPYTVEEQMPAAGETHPQGGAVIVRLFGPPEGAPAPALSPIPGLAGPQGAPVPPVALTPPADDGTRETPPENGGEPAESDTTTVPSLAGLDSVAAMRSALQAAGLTGDFVAQKNDKKEQEFKFAGQSHAPGTTVPKGTTITVSIYEAVEEGVAVPNLAGLASVAEVRAALSAAGLGVSFAAADPPSKEQEFKFAGQSHAPGTMVPKGTTITVSIYQQFGAAATAQASGIVPNVVDQTLQGAVAMLQSAGLRLGGIEVSAKPPTREQANRVYAQTPAAGEPIPASKTVALKRYAEFTEQAAAPAPAPDGTGGFDRAPVGPESDFVGHFEGESILARERGQASARDRWDRAPNRNVGRIRIDITRTGGQWAMCTSTLPNCIGGASALDSQGLHWQDGRGTSIDIKVAGSNLVGRMLMRSEGIGAGNFSEMLWTFTASRR